MSRDTNFFLRLLEAENSVSCHYLCYNHSAMALSSEEVRHIADLARLRLTETEEVLFAQQLSAILEYAARLNEIDTSHISPTASVLPLNAPLRPDEVRASTPRTLLLLNAEDSEEGMFRVPQVFE